MASLKEFGKAMRKAQDEETWIEKIYCGIKYTIDSQGRCCIKLYGFKYKTESEAKLAIEKVRLLR